MADQKSSSSFYRGSTRTASLEFPFVEDVSKYEKIAKIGQGTFGEVHKAKNRRTNQIVALKKIIFSNENSPFPLTAIREIKLLQLLRHPNIVHLKEVCISRGSDVNNFKISFFLVLEFCEHDLSGLLADTSLNFSLGEIKDMMRQMFCSLQYIHQIKIVHRDLKASNILITKTGLLKLADFGLARSMPIVSKEKSASERTQLTNRVVTLWYRAPELLLGSTDYTYAIDLWAAGCICAEFWTRSPLLQGKNEASQLQLIVMLCGPINGDNWPGVERIELYRTLELKSPGRRVLDRLGMHIKDRGALEIIDNILIYDSHKRLTAAQVLEHSFFKTEPLPTSIDKVMAKVSVSHYDMHKNKELMRNPMLMNSRRQPPSQAPPPPALTLNLATSSVSVEDAPALSKNNSAYSDLTRNSAPDSKNPFKRESQSKFTSLNNQTNLNTLNNQTKVNNLNNQSKVNSLNNQTKGNSIISTAKHPHHLNNRNHAYPLNVNNKNMHSTNYIHTKKDNLTFLDEIAKDTVNSKNTSISSQNRGLLDPNTQQFQRNPINVANQNNQRNLSNLANQYNSRNQTSMNSQNNQRNQTSLSNQFNSRNQTSMNSQNNQRNQTSMSNQFNSRNQTSMNSQNIPRNQLDNQKHFTGQKDLNNATLENSSNNSRRRNISALNRTFSNNPSNPNYHPKDQN